MIDNWKRRCTTAGFTIPELAVTIAVIAILASLTIPFILAASSALTASRGAREIQAALIQARTLALSTRQNICFQPVAGGFSFLQGSCAGAAWVGPNTDSTGLFKPADNVAMSGGGAIFTQFGTASTTAVITVTVPSGSSTTVTVQPSGRVTIP